MTKLRKDVILIIFCVLVSACKPTSSNPLSADKLNIHPNTYNLKLIQDKGLQSNLKYISDRYLELQKVYRVVLEDKVKKMLSLDDVNNELHTYDKYIRPHDAKDYDYSEGYQMHSTMNLDYVYLRNNIHLENMSKKDIELLKSKVDVKEPLKDKELVSLVDRTYKDVLRVDFYGSKTVKEEHQIPYTVYTSSCCALEPELWADRDAIVIGVRFHTIYTKDGERQEGYLETRTEILNYLTAYELEMNKSYKFNFLIYES